MAIAKMNRFTLLTFHSYQRALLKQLQVFSDVHFRHPDEDTRTELSFLHPALSHEQVSACETELEKVRFVVARMKPFTEKAGLMAKRPVMTFEEFDRFTAEYDYQQVYQKVKEQDDIINSAKAEISRRLTENAALEEWRGLDVEPMLVGELFKAGDLLGTVNKALVDEFIGKAEAEFDSLYIERLGVAKDDALLFMLFPREQYKAINTFVREHGFNNAATHFRGIPNEVIAENLVRIEELKQAKVQAEDEICKLTSEYSSMQVALDYFETVLERERVCENFLSSDTTVLIEGWVPVDDSKKLQDILQKVCGKDYYLEMEEVEHENTEVPIKLKNNKFFSAFESITGMYAMPRYNEIDPTSSLAVFYFLFFGMMVGDIGYGLIMLIGTSLALKLIDFKQGMRNFMEFFRYLSIAVILMGFVYGGMFGVSVFTPIKYINDAGEVAHKAILDSQLDIVTMLILSIVIGIVHIVWGLLTKTYMGIRDGQIADGLFDGFLWIVTLLSGIFWLLGATGLLGGPVLGKISMWVFIASIVGLALTQGRSSPSLGGKIGNGLYGVYGLTSYVGDIVSYTRIVALALSGAYIAYAFNLMTSLVVGDFSGPIVVSILRLIGGIVVVVFGQALNFGLALLGAYVHTCRLQYVEFFGKFYEGGGVVFRPFTFKQEYTNIKK